jgi:hypothetical protein
MKKLKLKLDGKEMLSKDQMKKISGGYNPCYGYLTCSAFPDPTAYPIWTGYIACDEPWNYPYVPCSGGQWYNDYGNMTYLENSTHCYCS